jgi:3-phenylpropionate/trans-cinnamate dioxygenase ferredoxin component
MTKLVAVADLDSSGVTVVEHPEHGALAVGVSNGEPFAVSNRCRHLFASLGKGAVADDGTLECPLHKARYDVHTGKMTRGPQGAFKPVSGVIRGTTGRMGLTTYRVEIRNGEIWLA